MWDAVGNIEQQIDVRTAGTTIQVDTYLTACRETPERIQIIDDMETHLRGARRHTAVHLLGEEVE